MAMTFNEYLKVKKEIDPAQRDLSDLTEEYYDEYLEYLRGVKEGCGPDE